MDYPPEWNELPPDELVNLALGNPPRHIKTLSRLLRRRPPDDDGIRALAESDLLPFLLVPVFAASGSAEAYRALRNIAGSSEREAFGGGATNRRDQSNSAARAMASVAPDDAAEQFATWLSEDPSAEVRGVAAVGLAALNTESGAEQIVEAALAARLSLIKAGMLLGRMSAATACVTRLLHSSDQAEWALGLEAANARQRSNPDDASLGEWRPKIAHLLAEPGAPTGQLRRWLRKWVEE